MTKKTNILPEANNESVQPARKLSKKEREELEREMNRVLGEVADSIEAGRIQAPWWRQGE